ncbi:MAG: DUF554 domain-containing protein [candidate division Zixibacteria bacterium]
MFLRGYIINTFTVLIGSGLGLLIGAKLPEKIKKIILSGLGLSTIVIGIQMALETQKLLLIVGSLILGGIVGQLIGIEEWLERVGEKLKVKVGSTSGTFVLGFVTASLLFCTGPMTIVGSLEDGYARTADLIYIKSVMDGAAAVALTASMGIGVIFSALTVLIFQGALTYFGMAMGDFINPVVLSELSAAGGILILGIGINILGIAKIRVGNFLPALAFAALFAWWLL